MKPFFIVFEGIDGSGKSTQCSLFTRYLAGERVPFIKLSEPTGGETGRKIRQILALDEMPDNEEILRLFIEDRRDDAAKNITPSLQKNLTVVMDRYYFSNAAYQGSPDFRSPAEILLMNISENFPSPDRVYFIDIPVDTALQRIGRRNSTRDGKAEIFEQKNFLEKVRNNFLEIRDSSFMTIDGTLPVDEITEIIINDYRNITRG